MSGNTIEYLIRLKDDFSAKMQAAAGVGQKGGAAIANGMAVAVAAGLKFKDEISAGWDVLNGNYEALGTVLGALPGPLGEIGEIAGTALGKMIKDTEQAAEGYRKLSNATGASVEFLSGFKEAADDVRVSGEAVDSALTKFARGLGGVKDMSDGVAENGKGIAATLKDIGVSANDSEGKVRPLASLLPDVADAFSKMSDGPQKTALAIQLFGKQGAELIPILNKGKEGIAEMAKAAEEAGLTMSGDTVAAVDKLKVAQDALSDAATGFGRKIGTTVIPALADLIKYMNYLTGVGDKQVEAYHKAENAIAEYNTTGKLSADTLTKLREGGAAMATELTKQIDLERKSSEGWGWMASGTVKNIDTMKQLYPEIFNVSEVTDKAAKSTDLLTEAQKQVVEGSVEYRDKTMQLTEAMVKRDDQLADIKKKEELLTQAHEKGAITSEQYAKGMSYLQDQTGKVRDTFDAAAGKIHDGVQATEAMDKAAGNAAQRERDFEQATKDAATAQDILKSKTENLADGIGKLPEKMDKVQKMVMAWKLATGDLTTTQAEQTLVGQIATLQIAKAGKDWKDVLPAILDFRNGAASLDETLVKLGAYKNPAAVQMLKDMREIEKATGLATESGLEHADYVDLVTRRSVAQKKTLDDVAEAQAGVNAQQRQNEEQDKKNKIALDNKSISEKDYIKAQIQGNEVLDQADENLRKVKASYEAKSGAVTYSTTVIDKYSQHLWETGKAAQDVGTALGGIPDANIKVTSDTSGFVTPLKNAKVDAEQPVTVPVDFKLNAPSFGVDKPTSPSVTLPVAFDTAGIDKQAASVKDSLAKLGPAGVSVSLDTISFDQTLLRVKSDLALIPDKSVAISVNVPSNVTLPDFSGLTGKNVSLTSDISDILTDISTAQKAVDGLTGKTAYLLADYSDVTKSVDVAQKAIDGLTGKSVDLKLTTSGNVELPTTSSISVSVTGDTADALTKIKEVVDTVIPQKTLYVYGNIDDAQTAMDEVDQDTVKAKTLIINAAHKAALGAEVGTGGKTFAMDAIDEVNGATLPLKTLVIAGDNTHAMGAIANTKNAMDLLKDKTVTLTVINKTIEQYIKDDGGGGKDDRVHDNALRNESANGTGKIIYLTQTFYMKDDAMTASVIKHVVRDELAAILNR